MADDRVAERLGLGRARVGRAVGLHACDRALQRHPEELAAPCGLGDRASGEGGLERDGVTGMPREGPFVDDRHLRDPRAHDGGREARTHDLYLR